MNIRNRVTQMVGRQKIRAHKNAPHIMFGLGLAGSIAGTVLACRATLKVESVLDEIQEEIDGAKAVELDNRDLAYIYAKSAGKLVKLYGPAVVVGGASVALLTGSHIQLTRRNTNLTVAYAALHKAYGEYRERVRAEVGDEKELDLYRGITLEDEKNGKGGKLAKRKVVDPNKLSPYARIFDEANPNWKPNAEFNRLFIQCQQSWMNQRLLAYGFVFLNEVYEALGFEKSRQGQVVGWALNGDGDNYVDFGLFEAHSADFVNGQEPSIILDFNVDGPILDYL